MIQWFSKNEKSAFVTIYPTNITINKAGSAMLKDSYAVMLGLDEDDYKIALQPISQDEYEKREFPVDNMFVLSGGKTYARVSSTDFVEKVACLMGCNFKEKARKYPCFYDQHEKLLVIDLKKEVSHNA